MKIIATLASVPSKEPREFELIWRSLETMYQPSNPPMSKGELLTNIKDLTNRGLIGRVSNRYYLCHDGLVDLSERIINIKNPLGVEEMYMMLVIGMFFISGRLQLTEEAGVVIRQRLSQGIGFKEPGSHSLFG